ncbi:MAG: hypothetical protein WD894_25685 [Pirellulales bacterium]
MLLLSAFIFSDGPFASFSIHRPDDNPSRENQHKEYRGARRQLTEPELISQQAAQTVRDAAQEIHNGHDDHRDACQGGHNPGDRLPDQAPDGGPQYVLAGFHIEIGVLNDFTNLLEYPVERVRRSEAFSRFAIFRTLIAGNALRFGLRRLAIYPVSNHDQGSC